MQVAEAVHRYGRHRRVTVLPVYGGQPIQRQLRRCDAACRSWSARQGALLDHIRRGSLLLDDVRYRRARRGGRDARHGLRRGHRGDPRGVPEGAAVRAVLRDVAAAHRRARQAAPPEPERITIEARGAQRRRACAQLAYVVPRRHKLEALGAHPRSWSRRRRRSSSAAPAPKWTT